MENENNMEMNETQSQNGSEQAAPDAGTENAANQPAAPYGENPYHVQYGGPYGGQYGSYDESNRPNGGEAYAYAAPQPSPEQNPARQGAEGTEPTRSFDAVQKTQNGGSSTGIKVFFSLLAITVCLIIAVSAGFIFGRKSGADSVLNYSSPTLENKNDKQPAADRSEVYRNVESSIVSVSVYTEQNGLMIYASGVIYTEDGYIITNDHIYSDIASPKFLVTMSDGAEYKAEFVAGDTRSDLAVLKINATGLKAAVFGNSAEVVVGEDVLAVGYPSGASGRSILTGGTISSTGIRVSVRASSATSSYTMKMIQTDTAINPGSSGGALVNMYSQVIGITSVKLVGEAYDSVGYAIPSAMVVNIADSLIRSGYVEGRGKLGISYTTMDSIAAELDGVPTGLVVREITADSDFNGKNLAVNDIITHINDTKITKSDIALDIIESTPAGVMMSFTVYHTATGTTETVYASLIPDPGSSSYSNVTQGSENPFTSDPGVYSDH